MFIWSMSNFCLLVIKLWKNSKRLVWQSSPSPNNFSESMVSSASFLQSIPFQTGFWINWIMVALFYNITFKWMLIHRMVNNWYTASFQPHCMVVAITRTPPTTISNCFRPTIQISCYFKFATKFMVVWPALQFNSHDRVRLWLWFYIDGNFLS
jgi:hypothetical protein